MRSVNHSFITQRSESVLSPMQARHPPAIKASSKKPPRCPTSHLNGESGHHLQHGRRRRESGEQEKGKAKRGAAKWKMKLVTAILMVCFGTLMYFQGRAVPDI